ncbi:MAG: YciK family oxidoreductase, partial [Paraperlucidibaca sp.]
MSVAKPLAERVVLITGASRGIGRAVALASAEAGATVVLLGREEATLNATYDAIMAIGGPMPAIITLDLSIAHAELCQAVAEQVQATFGRLDGLVHNAADLGDITPMEMYDPDTFDRVMSINLRAPFVLTQALLPLLKASPDASVIMTGSSVGRQARAFWGAYALSKFGVEGLTQLFADELKNTSSVRVNCVNPGATRTSMRASAYPGENPTTVKTPESIA